MRRRGLIVVAAVVNVDMTKAVSFSPMRPVTTALFGDAIPVGIAFIATHENAERWARRSSLDAHPGGFLRRAVARDHVRQ